MAECGSCGEDNPTRAKFCLACGSPLPAAAASREARKVITVVFADIVDSTALGERLDPEPLKIVLVRYF